MCKVVQTRCLAAQLLQLSHRSCGGALVLVCAPHLRASCPLPAPYQSLGDKLDSEIERILAEADKDGDGQIDYNEFVEVRRGGRGLMDWSHCTAGDSHALSRLQGLIAHMFAFLPASYPWPWPFK